jgi:hypothetical protein
MPRYDASSAKVLVFTFKEGLLSAAAHDLKLEVTKFTVDVEGTSVRAEFDATSLRVVTPMKDGRENDGSIPRALYGQIEKNAATAVLEQVRQGLEQAQVVVLSDYAKGVLCDAVLCPATHAGQSTGLGAVNLVSVGIAGYAWSSVVQWVVPDMRFNTISVTMRAQL